MKAIPKSIKTETLISCPVCGSPKYTEWACAKDLLMKITEQKFIYSKCNDCSSVFMSQRPLESEVGMLYGENYQPYLGFEPKKLIKLKALLQKLLSRLARIFTNKLLMRKEINFYRSIKPRDVLVDFGCGSGIFLNNFTCKTIGVDFSQIAIDSVKKNGHEGYKVDEFWQLLPNESVDFLRMNHVIEHLYHPKEILKKISSKMKSGGKLHIAVPNPDGLSAHIFRKNWHGLDCPRHIILYKSSTLVKMLEEEGFKDFEIYHESITKDFIRSFGYLISQFGLIKSNRVDALIEFKVLDIFAGLPNFFASKLGHGDRYHVFFTKS